MPFSRAAPRKIILCCCPFVPYGEVGVATKERPDGSGRKAGRHPETAPGRHPAFQPRMPSYGTPLPGCATLSASVGTSRRDQDWVAAAESPVGSPEAQHGIPSGLGLAGTPPSRHCVLMRASLFWFPIWGPDLGRAHPHRAAIELAAAGGQLGDRGRPPVGTSQLASLIVSCCVPSGCRFP